MTVSASPRSYHAAAVMATATPRNPGGRPSGRAVLLGALALLLSPAAGICPKKLDCTIKRREFCTLGLDRCGPCLSQFVEDEKGNCVEKHGMHHGASDIDGDIDYIASLLAKKDDVQHRLQLAAETGKDKSVELQDESRGVRADIPSNKDTSSSTTSIPPNTPDEVAAIKSVPKKAVPFTDAILLTLIIVCTVAGVSGLIIAGICWYRLQKEVRLTQKADYPGYGIIGSNAQSEKPLSGDKKLAQSAQMYHYQHQKQQMLSMEKNKDESKVAESATESEGENEDGDFTVYECPGLAPTGEMEVKNPLFDDSSLHHPPSQ
ncbi:neural proliferation differentiation and control protein 1-like isoform X1 [Carcharodon carcharias]|uniref:neural proliferation differentiation and control protein 1-like isoform X1 n=1 Tax=Carcharodon carcharias TaxID=13397 RepID=UPI001B7DC236|nr:neural proliferation differentiation and control protein 1-like isoform X1 [Carcharodon carcharias]